MDLRELRDSLLRIKDVNVAASDEFLIISNTIKGFSAKVYFDEIEGFKKISLPKGEHGIQIFYHYEGGLIVTENDFLFDTQQGPFFTVPNMPSFYTLNMLIDSFLDYRSDPTPSIHTYKNITFYYLQKYMIDSAEAKGFDLSGMQNELQVIKGKTGLTDVFTHIEYNTWDLSA